MGTKTGIEWTESTWTPIRARNIKTGKIGWHCEHATTGCEFCYAEGMNKRLGTGLPFKPGHRKDIEIFLDEEMLNAPLRWKKPRNIFVCSMTDLFASFVEDYQIAQVFGVMTCATQHVYQVLTKRSDRMQALLSSEAFWHEVNAFSETNAFEWSDTHARRTDDYRATSDEHDPENPPSNVWLGVSTERQQEADERIPLLLQTPAAVRFVSAEPLLGPIDLRCKCGSVADAHHIACTAPGRTPLAGLDWTIVGGESGPNARPMHPDWARSLRDQCAASGVPYFFKQHGEYIGVPDLRYLPGGSGPGFGAYDHCRYDQEHEAVRVGKKRAGRMLDGREHNEMPKVREA